MHGPGHMGTAVGFVPAIHATFALSTVYLVSVTVLYGTTVVVLLYDIQDGMIQFDTPANTPRRHFLLISII